MLLKELKELCHTVFVSMFLPIPAYITTNKEAFSVLHLLRMRKKFHLGRTEEKTKQNLPPFIFPIHSLLREEENPFANLKDESD